MTIDELIEQLESGSERGNEYDDDLMRKAAETIRLLWEIAQDNSNSKYRRQIDEMRGERWKRLK